MNMLERAAMALGLDVSRNGTPITWEPEERERLWRNSVSSGLADMQRAQARAALLAALDPADQTLVQCIARALYNSKPPLEADDFEFDAHSVLIALKAHAQGEQS